MFVKLKQRYWIKIEVSRGRSAQDCFERLREVYSVTISHSDAMGANISWIRHAVQDKLHPVNNHRIQLCASLFDVDRRWTARDVSSQITIKPYSRFCVTFLDTTKLQRIAYPMKFPRYGIMVPLCNCTGLVEPVPDGRWRLPWQDNHHQQNMSSFVRTTLEPALRRKWQQLLTNPIILHGNARSHTADTVKNIPRRWHWEIFEYPPYLPDISPVKYDIFTKEEILWRMSYNTERRLSVL